MTEAQTVPESVTAAPKPRFQLLTSPIVRDELPPILITAFRVGLGPLLVVGARQGLTSSQTALLIGLGFFSDIIDGYVARWLGVSNAMIRGFDSFADTIFYLAALYAVWHFRAPVLIQHQLLIGLLIATQILEHLIEVRKFGKPASYHAMSAKVWGVTLPIALITLLASGRDDFLVLALVAGFISHVDCFVITAILPEWRHDIATFYDALAIRRDWMRRKESNPVSSAT